tara:strand:- start:97 stop:597 length:501 start_codon:yes stop_codon:yes gene_type:complete
MLRKLKKLGLSKSTLGVFIVNWLFYKVLRINSKFPYVVHFTNKITSPKNVTLIGNGFTTRKCLMLNGNIYFGGSNGIVIHNSCLIANSVKVISGNHDVHDFDKESVKEKPIRIDQKCWLGAGSIILPGIHLRESTIVGAGAVVTKSFNQSNIVLVGNPARILKTTL